MALFPNPDDIAALDSLGGETRMFLQAAFNSGLSANAALSSLGEAGLGIRRTTGLSAYRALGGIRTNSNAINNVIPDFYPSERLFTPTAKLIGYNFRVWGYADVVDPTTGELIKLRAVVGFDVMQTRAGMQGLLAERMLEAVANYDYELTSEDVIITTAEARG